MQLWQKRWKIWPFAKAERAVREKEPIIRSDADGSLERDILTSCAHVILALSDALEWLAVLGEFFYFPFLL